VKAQIERSLRQQAAQNAARELGEKLVQEINTGQPLATVARKHGLTVHGPKLVTRDQPAGLERAVVDVAFRASRPEVAKAVAGGVDLGSKGFAVYAVTRVVEGDRAKVDAATREKAQRALAAQRGAGYYSSYRAGLKQKANVKIYQERL
jgi:hypothetical protein